MSEQQPEYRQIMKATSLFGGVQVYNILLQVIRSKVVAVLLGPAGMGIMGLLNVTIGFIGCLTNFGLGTSAVKNISEANRSADAEGISKAISVLQRLVWFTGLFGAIVAFISSPWLSQFAFKNTDYTAAFRWISISLLFSQLSSGQMALLQGMRKLKILAKANLTGGTLSLVITLPLYYFWGLDGIAPGIIASSLVSMIISYFYSHKIKVVPVSISYSQTMQEGKSMLKMGFLISLSGLLTAGAAYLLRIFISQTGCLSDVGLYYAGFAIINSYVGMIFSAMGSDYYPRLSAISNDNRLCTQTVNQQAEIAILILAPILVTFLIYIKWVVILLYSTKFVAVNSMIYWASLGLFFKVASWSIAFIFLAKGASKLFFWNELISNINMLILNLLGYHFWGLTGLGISFAVAYLLYLIQVYIVNRVKYDFSFNSAFVRIFVIQFGLAIVCFLCMKVLSQPYNYGIGTLVIFVSGWYSLKELEKRLGLKQLLKSFKEKRTKK